MIGQDPSKHGDWYEEDYVVLQLLRLLVEKTEAVKWEGTPEDGQGIDCWLTESGALIAVQCKTRRGSNWTIESLAKRKVLAYSKAQLETGGIDVYRFVSDARCKDLTDLIEKANATDDSKRWRRSVNEGNLDLLMKSWQLSAHIAADIALAHSLLQRIELDQRSRSAINESCSLVAGLVAPMNPDGVLRILTDLARNKLTRDLRKTEVAEAVARAGIKLEPRTFEPWVHDRLVELAASFIERITDVRAMDLIQRRESEKVLTTIFETPSAGSVLVHGPAGSGKSEVLAAIVTALRGRAVPVLALRPDMDNDEIGLGDDPIAALQRFSAGDSAVVVIDQLDQVLTSGQGVQQRLRRCGSWLRRARDAGFTIVVGCRTVDAEKEGRLVSLLAGSTTGKPEAVFVDDLDEPTVASALASKGVAANDLSPQVRSLARRPLFLRLILNLAGKGGSLTHLRGEIDLVDRWWNSVSRDLPGCDPERAGRALDQLIDRMDADGLLSAPEAGLDLGAIDALCEAGVLARYDRTEVPHVRPVHQVITDVRIALQWRDVATLADLLRKLGELPRQSLHQARRLRLTVPLILERPGGVQMLDELLRSSQVRPLLRRAVLLGIAAIDRPNESLVDMISSLLDDESLGNHVLDVVIRGNVPMIEALSERGWLDGAWNRSTENDPLRDRLLALLGSVALRWGDGVAEHLAAWSVNEPAVLDQTHRVLTHQPGDDTDALFTIRKEHIARNAEAGQMVDWKALLSKNPHRAFELLAVLLERTPVADLVSGDAAWTSAFPPRDALPPQSSTVEGDAWALLQPWWLTLDDHILQTSWFDFREDSALVTIVELLARCVARQLAEEPKWWRSLSRGLPDQQRLFDGWLLLRVGANLPLGASDAADILASWFTANPRWLRVRIGLAGGSWELRLPRDFAARVGEELSPEGLGEFEEWLLEFRDDWKATNERGRLEFMPSSVGLTSYRLLDVLSDARLSGVALRRLGELQRKFDGKLPEGLGEPKGGYIGSAIPDAEADSWSVDEWHQQIARAASSNRSSISATWHEQGERGIGVFTLDQLTAQLEWLAAADPQRYADLARAFGGETPPEARKAVLAGIAHNQPPDHYTRPTPWERLDDIELAGILIRPEYLDEKALERRLAWIIDKRPRYEWPDPVIARLAAIAQGATSAGMSLTDDFGLLGYRMNETACSAMHAFGEIARHQPARRPEALGVAQALIGHEDPGRRAAAASAAVSCYENDHSTAVAILFRATDEPRIAAERDLMGPLIWLATHGDETDVREGALHRLLVIATDEDDHVAERGGHAAVALRMHDAMDDSELGRTLNHGASARRGAAREVDSLLRAGHTPSWLLELVLRLADDPDEKTGDSVVYGVAYGPIERLAQDRSFFSRLLDTQAANKNLSMIIEGCDRAARLLPVADQIIELATKAAQPPEQDVEYWRRYENSRQAVNALARLVEEAEEESSFEVRERALDAWDALIEAGETVAAVAFDRRITDV